MMSRREMAAPAGLVPQGERIILMIRPDPAYVVLAPMWTLVAIAAAAVGASWVLRRWPDFAPAGLAPGTLCIAAALLALARVGWQAVDRAARRYVLTDRRILRVRGVFRRSVVDLRLDQIQHMTVTRLVRERVTGLGTLGFATAGTAWVEAHWLMIARPMETLEEVRRAVAAVRSSGGAL